MDQLILVVESDEQRLEIVENTLGFYIYRFSGEPLVCTHDYLQDDLDTALTFARDRFKVAIEEWREVSAQERQAYKDRWR